MEQQLIYLKEHYKELTVKNAGKLSKRATSLMEVWESNELSFAQIKLLRGEKEVKSILAVEIAIMVDLLKADVQDRQMIYMVEIILKDFYHYTISDLTALTSRLAKNNPYGKPVLQNILHELNQYSVEKDEFAVTQRIKECSKHKIEHPNEDKFFKMYQRLKNKTKKPEMDQKQKDQNAIKENQVKIEEMKKLYGINI